MRTFPTGDRIAERVKDIENRFDALIGESAALLADVTAARVAAGDDAILSQRPLARAVSLQQILIDGRRKVTGLHLDLARIAAAARDMPVGCTPDCLTIHQPKPARAG